MVSRIFKKNVLRLFSLLLVILVFYSWKYQISHRFHIHSKITGIIPDKDLHENSHLDENLELPLETIHIVLNGDSSYLIGLLAVLNSTYSTCKNPEMLKFHIITPDAENETILSLSIQKYLSHIPESSVDVIVLKEEFSNILRAKVWSTYRTGSLDKPIVYARFFFPKILPDLHKVIYLDNDVIVQKDISPLWRVDLGAYPIGAVQLCRDFARFRQQFNYTNPHIPRHPKASQLFNFSRSECSFNNGVLLYNLDMWRSHQSEYEEELLKWTHANTEVSLWGLGSQPPFNLVFYRNYKILPETWNLMDLAGLVHDFKKRIPKTRLSSEVANSTILHWNGEYKPWHGPGPYSYIWSHFTGALPAQLKAYPQRKPTTSMYLVTHPPVSFDSASFTIVIVSFARIDTLQQVVMNSLKSKFVYEIIIVWNNLSVGCPAFLENLNSVRCLPQTANLVHNRFLIWNEVKTDAVFHIDDDTYLSIPEMELGFRLWLTFQDQVIGYEPRRIVCLNPLENLSSPPFDSCSYGFQLNDGLFHLVIGKIFFVHKKFMKIYAESNHISFFNQNHPCEDIAMNFLVGNITNLPPVWFRGHNRELISQLFMGLSKSSSTQEWKEKRNFCVSHYLNIFQRSPLVPANYKVINYIPKESAFLFLNVYQKESWCSTKAGTNQCFQSY